MCAQPPAGLRPGLSRLSREMDGFTGSLGESRLPLHPVHHLPTCPCSGWVAGAARAAGSFTRVTAVFIKKSLHRPSGGSRATKPTAPPEGDRVGEPLLHRNLPLFGSPVEPSKTENNAQFDLKLKRFVSEFRVLRRSTPQLGHGAACAELRLRKRCLGSSVTPQCVCVPVLD